jgi:hypothetical protein
VAKRRGVELDAEFFRRPDIAATLAARDYLRELGALLQQLPEPWRAAANLVEEGGVTAEIQVALAFCRWYESDAADAERDFRESRGRLVSNRLSFLTRQAVAKYRGQLEAMLLSSPRPRRGRPRAPVLSSEDLSKIKAVYQRLLAEHRRRHGPAGDVQRQRILRDVAKQFNLGDPKALGAQLFRRKVRPA